MTDWNKFNSDVGQKCILPQRKSIRLKNYDYSSVGLYFITICTQNRKHLLGKISDGKMMLNNAGEMVNKIWFKIPQFYPPTKLHEFIIMPNHIHIIIEITTVGADSISARDVENLGNRAEIDSAPTTPTVSSMIQTFKRYSTIEYIKMVKQNILPPFDKRIWQRNYYEHIIRNEKSYFKITEYIRNNPQNWEQDCNYNI